MTRSGKQRVFQPALLGCRGRANNKAKKTKESPVTTRRRAKHKQTKPANLPPPAPPSTPSNDELLANKLGPTTKRQPQCLDYGIHRRILFPDSPFCVPCDKLEAAIQTGTASRLSGTSRRFICEIPQHTSYAFPFPFSSRVRPPPGGMFCQSTSSTLLDYADLQYSDTESKTDDNTDDE